MAHQQPTVGRPLPAAVQAARGASVCIVSGTIYLSRRRQYSRLPPFTSSVFPFIISTPTLYINYMAAVRACTQVARMRLALAAHSSSHPTALRPTVRLRKACDAEPLVRL